MNIQQHLRQWPATIALLIVVAACVVAYIFPFRIDLTSDKRYSIAQPTKQLVAKLNKPTNITIYLDGDLNASFLRLKRATTELLDELNVYAGSEITYQFVNPSAAANTQERDKNYQALAEKGMTPTVIYDKDEEGKSTQKIIFPWAEINYNGKTQALCLLKNIRGHSGEENLNISIETLEFELTDVLRLLTKNKIVKIAFLEGHGELDEANTYDISRALSRYFQIDRGTISTNATELDGYRAIVVAAPQQAFSETDKYIIDQYIMRGGRVLWLVDGVRFDSQSLSTNGLTPAIPLDVNLTDMLFRYGVRINAGVLQDEQCLLVPVNMAVASDKPNFQPMPWYFAPLLLTSPAHAVSRNVAQVSGTFVSTIDFVGNGLGQKREVLLASSNASHLISTPAKIDLTPTNVSEDYFNRSYLPVGVAIEGVFESAFAHRMMPQGVTNAAAKHEKSVPTRQIIVANGNLIGNAIENGQALPVGYDRYTQTQFGNRDFLVNALLYLADDEGWINLRNKEFTLRLLNKSVARTQRSAMQWLNVGAPLALLLIFGIGFNIFRKKRWNKVA